MTSDPSADKYNDPRAKITRRGLAIAFAVFLFGCVGSGWSIYARKTRLDRTREFLGDEGITAIQLGERMRLYSRGDVAFAPVELTLTPGLGHFRRLLLDERNYDWERLEDLPAMQDCRSDEVLKPEDKLDETKAKLGCIQVGLSDPTGKRFEDLRIDLDLNSGWMGLNGREARVGLPDKTISKIRSYLATVVNVSQKQMDRRRQE
ncbi:MAG: hypothetical protein AAF664_25310 [Planctomycetota bacterium]